MVKLRVDLDDLNKLNKLLLGAVKKMGLSKERPHSIQGNVYHGASIKLGDAGIVATLLARSFVSAGFELKRLTISIGIQQGEKADLIELWEVK